MTEGSESGLKLLLGLMVKCSCLEVPFVDHRQLSMKSADLWPVVVLLTPLGFVDLVV